MKIQAYHTHIGRLVLFGHLTPALIHELNRTVAPLQFIARELAFSAEHLTLPNNSRQELIQKLEELNTVIDDLLRILHLFREFRLTYHYEETNIQELINLIEELLTSTFPGSRHELHFVNKHDNKITAIQPTIQALIVFSATMAILKWTSQPRVTISFCKPNCVTIATSPSTINTLNRVLESTANTEAFTMDQIEFIIAMAVLEGVGGSFSVRTGKRTGTLSLRFPLRSNQT